MTKKIIALLLALLLCASLVVCVSAAAYDGDNEFAPGYGEDKAGVLLLGSGLGGGANGYSFNILKNLIIALVIGLVAALIVTGILKGQLKSVRRQNQANAYVKPDSMQLTRSGDYFMYRSISRTQRQKSSSSSDPS